MKITIDNRSKIPDHEILLCVDELIQKKKDYMEKNALGDVVLSSKAKDFVLPCCGRKRAA